MKTTILILAANPIDTTKLRLDEEVREIEEGLIKTQFRDDIVLKPKLAVRTRDIQEHFLNISPNIIHFSGHGGGSEGIFFEDKQGNAKPVRNEALADLFELFKKDIQCVVLNACYSEIQASAIAEHIPFVIGMNKAIGDKAAIEFSVAFYKAIGSGKNAEFAYKLGCNAIDLEDIPEHLTPVLYKNGIKVGATEPVITPIHSSPHPGHSKQTICLSFHLEQQNEHIVATWLQSDPDLKQRTPSNDLLPFTNSQTNYITLATALLGDTNNWQHYLQPLLDDKGVYNWSEANIRIRIMTNNHQLAMLPWHKMEIDFDTSLTIEVSPVSYGFQPGFSQQSIINPLVCIPSNQDFDILCDSHYRLIQGYFESYLDIQGAIPRVYKASQLRREIEYHHPDLIYLYAIYENSEILLDNEYESDEPLTLETLGKWLEETGIRPIIILSLIGSNIDDYPEKLVSNCRMLWIQKTRLKSKMDDLGNNLANNFESLKSTTDIVSVIQRSDNHSKYDNLNYLWVNGRSLSVDINDTEESLGRQFRAALLRITLGREEQKNNMYGQIYRSDMINNSAFLVYAVSGNKTACPFDFPAQLQQRLQHEDLERSLPVIPFYFHINVEPQRDAFDTIDIALSQGIRHGTSDISEIYKDELDRRGLHNEDCCISLNWLFTVAAEHQKILAEWLKAWANIICKNFSKNIPDRTVLVSAACIQVNDAQNEPDIQQTQDLANRILRQVKDCQIHHIHIELALGKLRAHEVANFLRNNQYWHKQLKLDQFNIDVFEFTDWVYEQVNGEFDPTVRKIWQQYQSEYQEYLARNT